MVGALKYGVLRARFFLNTVRFVCAHPQPAPVPEERPARTLLSAGGAADAKPALEVAAGAGAGAGGQAEEGAATAGGAPPTWMYKGNARLNREHGQDTAAAEQAGSAAQSQSKVRRGIKPRGSGHLWQPLGCPNSAEAART